MRTKTSEINGHKAQIIQLQRMIASSTDEGMKRIFTLEIENQEAEIQAIEAMTPEEFKEAFPEPKINLEEKEL